MEVDYKFIVLTEILGSTYSWYITSLERHI